MSTTQAFEPPRVGLTHHIKTSADVKSGVMEDTRSIMAHFGVLVDPRIDHTKEHKLIDIVVIALCAVICGAEYFTEMETFGNAKVEWWKTFLELPNGIPSHDTFGRVLSLLDPGQFQACFLNWVREIAKLKLGEVIAVDGKSLNGSADRLGGRSAAKMISAWASCYRPHCLSAIETIQTEIIGGTV